MAGYRDLEVWQEGKAVAVAVYKLTQTSDWEKDWGLRDQIRRSSVSVPSNIAEGEARNSQQDSIRFFHIALGSLAELSTQAEIAYEIGYLPQRQYSSLQQQATNLERRLGALIRARKSML